MFATFYGEVVKTNNVTNIWIDIREAILYTFNQHDLFSVLIDSIPTTSVPNLLLLFSVTTIISATLYLAIINCITYSL